MANLQTRIPSQHEILKYLQLHYKDAISLGLKRPFLFPQVLFSFALLAQFLLIDHRRHRYLYMLRWPVWFSIIAVEVSNIHAVKIIDPALSYISGVASIWVIVWSSVWLIFQNPQFTAKRIRRQRKVLQNRGQVLSNSKAEQVSETAGYQENGDAQHKAVQLPKLKFGDAAVMPKTDTRSSEAKDPNNEWEYYWQSYPDTLQERIGWVLDLIFSFRGSGWNFSIRTNPALPPEVVSSLRETSIKFPVGRTGIERFRTRKELALYAIPTFILCYITLDLCKLQIIHDPFFRTGDDSLSPPAYLEGFSSFFITMIRRNSVFIAITAVIELLALVLPILFSLILGPNIVGIYGEPWMFPVTLTPPTVIFDKGLGGFWNGWWHQTFRIGFTAPTDYFIRKGWLRRKSVVTRVIALTIAFLISGIMHSIGSLVQTLPTRPARQLVFFLLQIAAVMVQTTICAALRPLFDKFPRWVRRTGNGIFVYLWLYTTIPLFADDMSAGGSWLFEPLVVSPMRWLGLGPEGYGWWTWNHDNAGWHCGKHWWQCGFGGI